MWNLTKARLHNLFSHELTEFKVIPYELLMIFGVNADDPGSDSNGGGKSSLIECIHLAITGNVARKVNREEYIRDGQEFCEVYVEFENDVLQKTFAIERKIYNGKESAELKLYEDGVFCKQFVKRTLAAQKHIYDVLGINEEDFLNYDVISQGTENSFFSSTDSRQKQVIQRFSNFINIDNLLEEIKKEIKNTEENLAITRGQIDAFRLTLEETKKAQVNLTERAKKIFVERRQTIKEEIAIAITELEEAKKEAQEDAILLKECNKLISEKQKFLFTEAQLTTKKTEIEKIKIEISKNKETIREANTTIGELEIQTGKKVRCPKCKLVFIPNSDLKPEEVSEYLNQLKAIVQQEENAKIKNDLEIGVLGDLIKNSKVAAEEIAIQQRRAQGANNRLSSDSIKHKEAKLQNLKNKYAAATLPAIIKELRALLVEMDDFQPELKKLEQKIVDLTTTKEELMFEEFHFGRKGFKTYLANKSIRRIQDTTNYYLNLFNINLQVEINGYKVTKTGEIRDKIEVWVWKNGLKRRLYNAYSGGEKSRVNICNIIALHKIINNSAPYGKGLNLLIFDEYIDGLDKTGKQEAIKILAKANITSMLVTHHVKDLFHFPHAITVERRGEISKIISQ